MTEQELERLHAVVEGYVQGVGFRMFVEQQAATLGLVGWVRNHWEGSVEVLVEGRRAELESLLEALRRGPRSAVVHKVATEWQPATGEFGSFQVRSTV
ncbi:MAG: acylphosphatase [Anaerolineales bacterium]|nr:acylphosphatase [Anaerolineales bacterium]